MMDDDPKSLIEKFIDFVPSDNNKFSWLSEVNEV